MHNNYNRLLKHITVSLFFLLAALFFIHEIFSLDIWLHLGTGKYILENFKIPTYNVFSYTLPDQLWINHEWLFQIITYSLYNTFGPNGLIIMRALVFILTFVSLFRWGYKKNNSTIIIMALLPALILTRSRFFIRPEIFTLLFTALYLLILHKYKSTKLIYILMPIQLLWVNIHGYFLIGLIIVFSYISGELLARFINLPSRTKKREVLNRDEYVRLIVVGFLLIAVCLITPYTYKGLLYPFKTLFHFTKHSEFLTNHIMELQKPLGPFFKYPLEAWYRGLGFISAVLILLNIKKIHLGEYILFILFFTMSVFSNRNVPLFSFIAALTIICSINNISIKLVHTKMAQTLKRHKRLIEGLTCVLLIAFMLRIICIGASAEYYVNGTIFKNINFGVSKRQYSKGVIEFIKENNITGNVFNNFDMGAYLIGNVYPQCKVFIDGRTEVYGVNFLRRYYDILFGGDSFEDVANRYNISYAILGCRGTPLEFLNKLYRRRDWKLVYFDGIATVFAKDAEENKELINRYEVKLTEPKMDLSKSDIDKLRKKNVLPFFYLARSCFYRDVNLHEFAIKEIENGLIISPDCGQCYYAMGIIYSKDRRFQDAIKAYKTAIKKGYDNEFVRQNLGSVYARMQFFDCAVSEFKKALRFNSKYLSAKRSLKNCKEVKKTYEDELGKLNEEISNAEDNLKKADIYYEAAKKFYNMGCYLSTVNYLNKLLELNPDFPDGIRLHNMLGISFAQLGFFEKAEEEFKNALKSNPRDIATFCNLGFLYFDKRDFSKANRFWQKALNIDPNCKLAQDNLKKL